MTNICLAFLGSGVSFIFGYTHILLAPNGAPHVNLPTVNDVGECETLKKVGFFFKLLRLESVIANAIFF